MKALAICQDDPSMSVPYLLMAAYLYYDPDRLHIESPMADEEYDQIARLIVDKWDEITHPHKHLLQKAKQKGTISLYRTLKFPLMVKGAAQSWARAAKEATNGGI